MLVADDDFKLNALWEIVQTRLVRRNVPVKNLTRGDGQARRQQHGARRRSRCSRASPPRRRKTS